LLAEVVALRAENARLLAQNATLLDVNAKVLAENAELKAEVAGFQSQLAVARKNPRNSSKPPSTEHPHAKPTPKPHAKPKTSNDKRGGQPGHEKHARELVPVEQCASVVDHKPQACRGCGARLKGGDPEPDRKQAWDLPVIRPEIIEHRLHRLICACCGKVTSATLPAGMPTSEAGPRLLSPVALLTSHSRCGKRKTAEFVWDVLNIPFSPDWVVKLQSVVTTGLRPAYDDLPAQLPDQPSLNIDESPTKQANRKAWVWAFVASTFTVFTIRLSRKADPLRELLVESSRSNSR
jgi:transposase